jgi:uncharacterized protein YaaQ
VDRLVVAIVHRADADAVADALRAGDRRFTVLSSVGGFLGAENATFLVGCQSADVDGIVETIRGTATEREVEVPLVLLGRIGDWQGSVVRHGAATIWVLEVAQSHQL